jgi:RNA polymerase sigma factor (sigma-70 family)
MDVRERDFDRLYSAHAQDLFAFLAYRTGDRALAEDLLADTFERVLSARRGYDRRRGSEKTWLYAIALNVLRDHLRRAGAEARAVERTAVVVAAGAAAASDPLAGIENREWLAPALAALSEEEREAIALRFGAELTLPEMAKLLHQRLTTVEGRVYRALRKLRDELS